MGKMATLSPPQAVLNSLIPEPRGRLKVVSRLFGMGNPVSVQARGQCLPAPLAINLQRELEHPTGGGIGVMKAIENKITKAVKNRFAFINLDVLSHMRMAPHDCIGALINHPMRQLHLGP